ncbi:phosphotransferase [Streptomyces sp. NPDC048419]|uniref:phosphotransferase n=1 Tax=Streptomyces sp. NPDC048419 TaxID=3365547 RepID=UPI003710B5C0
MRWPAGRGGPGRRAGASLVKVLAALHPIDPVWAGLGAMARPHSCVERQLRRWQRQVHRFGAPGLELFDTVDDVLLARVPAQFPGIVHGDFRPGSLSFAPDGTVIAVFGWEPATPGDPPADRGRLASTCKEPGDTAPPTTLGPSAAPGFGTRAELIDTHMRRRPAWMSGDCRTTWPSRAGARRGSAGAVSCRLVLTSFDAQGGGMVGGMQPGRPGESTTASGGVHLLCRCGWRACGALWVPVPSRPISCTVRSAG